MRSAVIPIDQHICAVVLIPTIIPIFDTFKGPRDRHQECLIDNIHTQGSFVKDLCKPHNIDDSTYESIA